VSEPPEKDPAKAYAEALGDLNAISLETLDGGGESGIGLAAGPLSSPPGQENSFADARLDAPPGAPLRSGDADSGAASPPPSDVPKVEGDEVGLDLALVDGGAVVVSAQDLARGKKDVEKPKHDQMESRGATGVAAPSFDGPAPAGHMARPQGLFFYDPVSNILASVAIAALVCIAPAWIVSSSTANSDDALELITALEALHKDIEILEDPERGEDGPQTLEAVTAALTAKANEVDQTAGALEEIVQSSHTRFWGVWFGLGIPLGIALSVLRRKG
jgi:hypothetical protein